MSDVTLSTGREVSYDLSALTLKEYRGMLSPAQPDFEDDKVVARCAGMTPEEIGSLLWDDYRRLLQAFFRKAGAPLADPNSQSASTSP